MATPEADHADGKREPVGAALVVGAGDATGGAIARRFAREGYAACVTRRTADKLAPLVERIRAEGGTAHGYASDARKEDDVVALVERIEREVAPIEVAVFNIGANVRFGLTETTARVFTKVWEMACFAGFVAGREAAKHMVPRGRGTILFTGATASVRGREGYSAFAAAKHGLRAVAQSMARELGPEGIHVGHIVIDGGIDGVFVRGLRANAEELLAESAILKPEEIAQSYVALHRQGRSAWTHELDVRPWKESW